MSKNSVPRSETPATVKNRSGLVNAFRRPVTAALSVSAVAALALSPLTASAASAAPASSPAASSPAVASSALQKPSVPATGFLFGASVGKKYDTQKAADATSDLETLLGRKLDIDRSYSVWDDPQPSSQVSDDLTNGRLPFLSIYPKTRAGVALPWAYIAAGRYDAQIKAQADGLRDTGKPILLAFHHEPELAPASMGTAADFVAAYRHYVQVFRAEGANNVAFSLVLVPSTATSGQADKWYPGDDVIDWLSADAYNFNSCTSSVSGNRSLAQAAGSWYSWASTKHKPLALAEWGTYQDPNAPAGTRAAWLRDAEVTLSGWTNIKALAYFDHAGSCPWWITSDQPFQDEFKAFANGTPSYGQVAADLARTTDASIPYGSATSFDLSASTGTGSPAGTGVDHWTLDFGDGSQVTSGTGQPGTVTHSYTPGSWTATLTVWDASGIASADTSSTTVIGAPGFKLGTAKATATAVTLPAWIDTDGLAGSYRVEYGTTPALGSVTTDLPLGTATTAQTANAGLAGLTPGTTYYYRIAATTAAGTSYTDTASITTVGAPTVKQGTPSNPYTTASMTAYIDTDGLTGTYHVEYGTTPDLGTVGANQPLIAQTWSQNAAVSVSGLTASTTYYLRTVATTDGGTTAGPVISFTTAGAPTVKTGGPTSTATTSITLTGWLNGTGLTSTYWVEYGTSSTLGTTTAASTFGPGSATVSPTLTGLAAGKTYSWRIVARNVAGTTYGPVRTFKTAGTASVVVNNLSRTASTATAKVSVNPNGHSTKVWLEYGTGSSLTHRTPMVTTAVRTWLASEQLPQLTGLKPSTTYTYRIVTQNAAGTTDSGLRTFTTRKG